MRADAQPPGGPHHRGAAVSACRLRVLRSLARVCLQNHAPRFLFRLESNVRSMDASRDGEGRREALATGCAGVRGLWHRSNAAPSGAKTPYVREAAKGIPRFTELQRLCYDADAAAWRTVTVCVPSATALATAAKNVPKLAAADAKANKKKGAVPLPPGVWPDKKPRAILGVVGLDACWRQQRAYDHVEQEDGTLELRGAILDFSVVLLEPCDAVRVAHSVRSVQCACACTARAVSPDTFRPPARSLAQGRVFTAVPACAAPSLQPRVGAGDARCGVLQWRRDAEGDGPVMLRVRLPLRSLPPTARAAPWEWHDIRSEFRPLLTAPLAALSTAPLAAAGCGNTAV